MKYVNHIFRIVVLFLIVVFVLCFIFTKTLNHRTTELYLGPKSIWSDCQSLEIQGKGWTNTESFYDRLPAKAKKSVPKQVWQLSKNTAGMSIHFTTDASSIELKWKLLSEKLAIPKMLANAVSGLDLYSRHKDQNWQFVQNAQPDSLTNTASFRLNQAAEYMLYLPLYNGIDSVQIAVPEAKKIASPDKSKTKTRKPVVFYGTSITQGACASRPGMAAVAIVGRKLNVPVINLGFAGNARMELALAELIAELDASVYVIDCLWNMTDKDIHERFEPFVKKLRQLRPSTPILLAEDSSYKNHSPTSKGIIVRSIYQKLKEQAITNLHFLPNRLMLGTDTEGTIDAVHPNDLGMMRLADVFVNALTPILNSQNSAY